MPPSVYTSHQLSRAASFARRSALYEEAYLARAADREEASFLRHEGKIDGFVSKRVSIRIARYRDANMVCVPASCLRKRDDACVEVAGAVRQCFITLFTFKRQALRAPRNHTKLVWAFSSLVTMSTIIVDHPRANTCFAIHSDRRQGQIWDRGKTDPRVVIVAIASLLISSIKHTVYPRHRLAVMLMLVLVLGLVSVFWYDDRSRS